MQLLPPLNYRCRHILKKKVASASDVGRPVQVLLDVLAIVLVLTDCLATCADMDAARLVLMDLFRPTKNVCVCVGGGGVLLFCPVWATRVVPHALARLQPFDNLVDGGPGMVDRLDDGLGVMAA